MRKMKKISILLFGLLFVSLPLAAQQFRGNEWDHDSDDLWLSQMAGQNPWLYFAFKAIKFIIITAVIITVLYFLKRTFKGRFPLIQSDKSMEVVRKRYAKGEIDEETLKRMLETLEDPELKK